MKLYLARHGETDFNIEDRYQGSSNAPLNHHGMTQARRLAHALPGDVQHIVSSAQLCAMQTAYTVALARGMKVEVLSDLCERDYGVVEGLTPAEVALRYPALAPTGVITGWDATPVRGETTREVVARVSQVLANLQAAHAGQVVLVCAHAFVLRALHFLLEELPEAEFFAAPNLGNGEFFIRHLREPMVH